MMAHQKHEGKNDAPRSPSSSFRPRRPGGAWCLRHPGASEPSFHTGCSSRLPAGQTTRRYRAYLCQANGSPGCGFWRNANNRLLHSSGIPVLHPNQPGAPRMNLVLEKHPGACPKLHPQDSTPLIVVENIPSFADGIYRFRANNMNCEITKASGIGKCEPGTTR